MIVFLDCSASDLNGAPSFLSRGSAGHAELPSILCWMMPVTCFCMESCLDPRTQTTKRLSDLPLQEYPDHSHISCMDCLGPNGIMLADSESVNRCNRYATLWPACSQALGMALQTHPHQAWKPVLEQLQEAQRLHLSASRQPPLTGQNACPVPFAFFARMHLHTRTRV